MIPDKRVPTEPAADSGSGRQYLAYYAAILAVIALIGMAL